METIAPKQKTIPTLNADVIGLQKGFVVLVDEGQNNIVYASTVQAALIQYGYMLDDKAFEALKKAGRGRILEFHDNLVGYLKNSMGGKYNFTPLYGDFPITAMSDKDAVVIEQAILHFMTAKSWDDFSCPVMDKPVKFEDNEITVLKIGDEQQFNNVFKDILSINQSLAPVDIEIAKWFAKSGRRLAFPEKIPFKENLCVLAALDVPVSLTGPTDVLRVAVYMSGGDISLPAVPPAPKKAGVGMFGYRAKAQEEAREKFKFKKFSREERRRLLEMLEAFGPHLDVREMVLKDERWIRLGEILHPGEYKKRYPRAFEAFMIMRRGIKQDDQGVKMQSTNRLRSWYGVLNDEFKKGLIQGLNYLVKRPGEFMRRMDWLVRRNKDNVVDLAMIMNRFKIAAGSASNKVLYELYGHFVRRGKPLTNRKVMIKGARKPTKLPDLEALDEFTVNTVLDTVLDSLRSKFRKLDPMGKVWVDPELEKLPIPTNMRSTNFSTKPVTRGSRIPIGNQNSKVIRAFFHWVDKKGQYDFDLSGTFVRPDGRKEVLNYIHLKVGNSYHSGDIIRQVGPCAEYVDIDIADALSSGYKYVLIDVRGYQGEALKESEGVFGIMEREFPEANKTWLPSTVKSCHQMNSDAMSTLCTIIDLETREYIFLDIDGKDFRAAHQDPSGDEIMDSIKTYCEPPRFSVAHLLKLHVDVRGELVDNPADADLKLEFKDFANDYVKTSLFMGI